MVLGNKIIRGEGLQPNVFLGNIADVVTSQGLMAADLRKYPSGANLVPDDLQNYTVNGNDVSFYIDFDYTIISTAWASAPNMTYFRDEGGYLKKIGTTTNAAFGLKANLTELKIDSVLSIVTLQEFNTTLLTSGVVNLPNCTNIRELRFNANTTYNIPVCTTLGLTVGDDRAIWNSNANTVVNANTFLATNNGGNPDGDLQRVVTNGGTVNYV